MGNSYEGTKWTLGLCMASIVNLGLFVFILGWYTSNDVGIRKILFDGGTGWTVETLNNAMTTTHNGNEVTLTFKEENALYWSTTTFIGT